jgi:predicted GNAT family acetyltransferase
MKPVIKNKSNDIIEILFENKNSYIRLQKCDENTFCVITTFVDPSYRGKGIGNDLYLEMIKFIRSNNVKFKATCPYIAEKATKDESVKDIFVI